MRLPCLVECRRFVFAPCPDAFAGESRPTTSAASTPGKHLDLLRVCGAITGMAIRQGMLLPLNVGPVVWRALVGLPVRMADLAAVAEQFVTAVRRLGDVGEVCVCVCVAAAVAAGCVVLGCCCNALGDSWCRSWMRRRASSCTTKCMPTWIATAWYERGFSCVVLVNTQVVTLALRTRGCHLPFHQRMPATAVENRVEFAREAESIALRASDAQLAYYFRGMGQALPVEVFPVFTPSELETLFTGSSHINLSVLKSATDYHNCSEADPHIQCVAPRAVRECFCVSVDVIAAMAGTFGKPCRACRRISCHSSSTSATPDPGCRPLLTNSHTISSSKAPHQLKKRKGIRRCRMRPPVSLSSSALHVWRIGGCGLRS